MFYTAMLLLAAVALVSSPPRSRAAFAERAESGRPVIHHHSEANSKTDHPGSVSTPSELRAASPFEDLDRKFEADRRKINAAITICRC